MSDDTAANENGGLQEFDVTITETLQKTVRVKAADQTDAEMKVSEAYYNQEYVLDYTNYIDAEFDALPADLEITRDAEPHEKGDNHNMEGNNANISQDGAPPAPLSENQYVQELFSVLRDNGRDATGLTALIGHVSEMENFVKRAEDKIAEMKSQLAEMKEVQNHPVKNSLQNAIKTLDNRVADIKERLVQLRLDIAGGCVNALNAFKEKGAAALDKLASFFHIKGGLQEWNKNIDAMIRTDDKAVAKIETFATEYHTAGRAIKNMARLAVGKQPIDAKKEAGKLAKTIAAPYKAQKAILTGLKNSIDKAIKSLEGLETKAAARQENRQVERTAAKKPSLLGQLQENLTLVEQRKREAPIQERAKTKGTEL